MGSLRIANGKTTHNAIEWNTAFRNQWPDRIISKVMEKTDLDNQVQQCVGSYKPARISLVQVYELNKKMIVLNSWAKLK